MTPAEQYAYLTKGCVDVVREADLRRKLGSSAAGGRPLRVKVGFDPTAPDLHLGHTVLIRKMKHFQDLGHRVVFVIGDFTGLIGDPTGRSKARPPLTREEIDANAETYKSQVFKLLDPDRTVVEFNSRWLGALGSEGLIRLAARYSVAQMLERREFRQRYDEGRPITIHEFLYPLAQAYDSVHLETDVELGGTDQLFNLNVGRDIMPSYDLPAQVVLTTPLLVGLDGVEKMSKSANNYVGITEPPDDMFGKLMSIADPLMWPYYTLLTDRSEAEIAALRRAVDSGDRHPKDVKAELAAAVVTDFHGSGAARDAAAEFERRFARKALPSALPEHPVAIPAAGLRLTRVLVDCGFAPSAAAAGRLIRQGSVRLDGQRVEDPWRSVAPGAAPFVLQVGKRRVARVVAAPSAAGPPPAPDALAASDPRDSVP
ncbi:MAG: tyrosine--tRNA ligase [Acidobacteria bacterium]|nr:tyrosine--tRNA ligase [Acidobacteriota bacterium]